MNLWVKAAIGLALIWAIAFGLITVIRAAKPTAKTVAHYFAASDLEGKSAGARAQRIDQAAAQLNRLPYEERQKLRRSRGTDEFFRSLSADEQLRFLDATLPTGFKQMMEAFNKMDRQKRKRIVDRTLADMKERDEEGGGPPIDDKNVQRIVDQGLRSFYNDSSAEVKADLSPLIEQLQQTLQHGGR